MAAAFKVIVCPECRGYSELCEIECEVCLGEGEVMLVPTSYFLIHTFNSVVSKIYDNQKTEQLAELER